MNERLNEKRIGSQEVFTGGMIKVRVDQVQLPNGRLTTREVVEHPGAVAVVPIMDNGSIIMVRQFRYAVGKVLLEIPAGKLNPGEVPDICAHRELEEETGYQAADMRKLSATYMAPGFTNEIIHIYEAKQLTATKQNPDEDEFLDIVCYTREEVIKLFQAGLIEDAKTIVGLYMSGVLR